jgi:mannose-6-phosphate isomerase-like protein (cupin superfamily)
MTAIDGHADFGDRALSNAADEIAPDGSQVRILASVGRGGMGHFTIPAGQTIRAVRHKNVDEIWYILQGEGEMWRKGQIGEVTISIRSGLSLTIPVGVSFQVRNLGPIDICVIGQTMPPWPGNDEAEYVKGKWAPTLIGPAC